MTFWMPRRIPHFDFDFRVLSAVAILFRLIGAYRFSFLSLSLSLALLVVFSSSSPLQPLPHILFKHTSSSFTPYFNLPLFPILLFLFPSNQTIRHPPSRFDTLPLHIADAFQSLFATLTSASMNTEEGDDRSSSTPTSTNKQSAQDKDKPRLTDQEKKSNHIASEQKRRAAIREGFDRLTELVPGLEGQGRSESIVLQKTVDFIHTQLQDRQDLIAEIETKGGRVDDSFRPS